MARSPYDPERHFAERTMPALERGFASAGRDRDGFEIILEVICAIGRTEEELAIASYGGTG